MSEEPFPHLSARTRAMLARPKAERLEYVSRAQWLTYPAAEAIEKRLDEIMAHGKVERMPCALVVGRSDNGKTTVLAHFFKQHPPVVNKDGDLIRVPALRISAPSSADEAELFLNIVKAFGVPYNPADKLQKLADQAFRLVLNYQVHTLVIDEFNMIGTGPIMNQRKVLNKVRILSKNAQISIVAAGTRNALTLLSHDSQFETRFEPLPLPRWKKDSDVTLDILASIETGLPLPEPSGLADDTFAERIVEEAEETIGGIRLLTTRLARYAIENDKKKLTTEMIKEINWIKPSKRAKLADDQI